MKLLLYGYGNPGRQDDGLGIAFVERMKAWVVEHGYPDFEFENNYQLNIEDADAISDKDLVIFADASQEEINDFCFSKVDGSADISFTTHAASPGYIVKLCKDLFHAEPLVLLIHIRGYSWEFAEGISKKAERNLERALEYAKKWLMHPEKIQDDYDKMKFC